MNGIKYYRIIILFLCMFNVSTLVAAESVAGKTLLTRGEVIGKRGDTNVVLKRRSEVFENDEIHVGDKGRAQFRMIDKALISLQENSVLQIKKYRFKQGGRNNSALLELLSGGLRTITGAIGKGNKKAYELRTPLATIGIRGTDYEVEIVANGMFVGVWDGVIHLLARVKNGCDMLLGQSQPYMFVFIDSSGQCELLEEVPDVFKLGHSSNINPKKQNTLFRNDFVVGRSLQGRPSVIEPLLLVVPSNTQTPVTPNVDTPITPDTDTPTVPDTDTPVPPMVDDTPTTPDVDDPTPPQPPPPVVSFDHKAFTIDQSRPSVELSATSTAIDTSTPTFKVGSDLFGVANNSDSDFTQSVGGYHVSWGYWGEFATSSLARNVTNSGSSSGLLWATYDASDATTVGARTGSFSRFENITDSLLSGTQGAVSNLQVQMDVNFDTGNVTNGALSANTPNETWVAVFDGQIQSGDLDLQMNGASVIDSNPATPSPARDASGFIAGDFIGANAEAIIGAFGLSETANPTNHIEGVFVVEEAGASQ